MRKRKIENFIHLFSWIWFLVVALSYEPAYLQPHPLAQMFRGSFWSTPWLFTSFAVWLSFSVTIIACVDSQNKRTSWRDLGHTWSFVVVLTYTASYYMVSYDFMYYLAGNHCIPWINRFCLNFSSKANFFGLLACGGFLIRCMIVILSKQVACRTFAAGEVEEIRKAGLYFSPRAPVPHAAWFTIVAIWETSPFLWDMYVHPDGRESSHQQHIR